jgi:hypothetical protein
MYYVYCWFKEFNENHILYWSTYRPKYHDKEEMEKPYPCIMFKNKEYISIVTYAVCDVHIIIGTMCHVKSKFIESNIPSSVNVNTRKEIPLIYIYLWIYIYMCIYIFLS